MDDRIMQAAAVMGGILLRRHQQGKIANYRHAALTVETWEPFKSEEENHEARFYALMQFATLAVSNEMVPES